MTNTSNPPAGHRSTVGTLAKWFAVCAILGAVFIFFGRKEHATGRAVIISSDDAGMCSSVNRGTMAALQAGIVKSTSIMTCCPAFDEFAEFAKSHPEYDYGVHLTLTCDLRASGWGPVLPASEVPSLVDRDRFFHPSTSDVARLAKYSEVAAELRAQIRKATAAGIRVSHLDHHMWVLYARPDLLRLYVQLGREFGLPIRFSREVPAQLTSGANQEAISNYEELRSALEQGGFPILDRIEADNYAIAPGEKRLYFLTSIRNLAPGVTEIVIHCAGPDESQIEPPDPAARYADAAVFSAIELRDELARLRIDVLDWKGLARRK